MWSRDSPFALLAIGGERHIEDRRFWVEHPNTNDSSSSMSVCLAFIRCRFKKFNNHLYLHLLFY